LGWNFYIISHKEYPCFFGNLEKKHFTEKIDFKISSRNNQDPEAILTEQNYFNEKLYKSSNPRHEELHSKLFLNNDNPFILEGMQLTLEVGLLKIFPFLIFDLNN
jgi:hypothetical protein